MGYNTRSRQSPKKDEVESVPEVTKSRRGRPLKQRNDGSFNEVKDKPKKGKVDESFTEATEVKPKRGRKLVKDKSVSASTTPTKRVTRSSSVLNEVAEQVLDRNEFDNNGGKRDGNDETIQLVEPNKSPVLTDVLGSKEVSTVIEIKETIEQTQVVNENIIESKEIEKEAIQTIQTVESMDFYSREENLESRQQSTLNEQVKESNELDEVDKIIENIEVKETEIIEDNVVEENANTISINGNNLEGEREDSDSDGETDRILQNLLEVEKNKKDAIIDEEIEQNDIIEEQEKDVSEESNYFSLSDDNEDEIDDNYLNSLLAKAKQNLSNPIENTNNKEFNPNKAFNNPYDEKIKHNLYIQTGNKSKDRKHGFRPVAIQTEIVQTKEIIPGMSNKRKSLEQVEEIDNDTFISKEVANALEVSSRKGLDQLNINRSLDGPRITRKDKIKEKESTAGKKWFDMPAPIITDELKRDLQVLKLRKVLDRKRFYKKDNKGLQSKYFQVGTIIEDKSEFYSARLNNKDRKQNIVQELLHDDQAQEYFKDRFLQHQQINIANSKRPTKLKKFKNKK